MQLSLGTLIGQGITFLIFILVTMKFVWPSLTSAMEERRRKIADGLAAAEEGKRELEKANDEAAKVLKEAHGRASEIVEQARKQANKIVDDAKSEAQQERQRQLAATQQEIELEAERARESLRGEVATLAVAGASQLLKREIDAQAHSDVLDKLVAEL